MYTQNLGLQEELAIVDELQLLDGSNVQQEIMLVPNNKAEIYLVSEGKVGFQALGSVRQLEILDGNCLFMMPRRRGASLKLSSGAKCLILKLNPIYAKKISDQLDEVSNGIFEFEITSGLIDQLMNACTERDIYEASDAIHNTYGGGKRLFDYNLTILESMDQIRHSCGNISVKEIYNNLNVSKSKLEQHFNREIGLTPKEFCKIEKINFFINTYSDNAEISLTELTYQCGYYDQSHLIKDFKYFLDTSPKKYFNSYYSL